jgi:predicted RNA methylase
VVLEAVDKLNLKPDDVFYDLGSGLGRVVILANLLSGAQARGIEINPVLDEHAREFANRLALPMVTFIKADVREVDFSDGTVFFMYTPFTGEIMDTVLEKLHRQSLKHPLRIATYGPCTMSVSQQEWLHTEAVDINNPFDPVIFHSRG